MEPNHPLESTAASPAAGRRVRIGLICAALLLVGLFALGILPKMHRQAELSAAAQSVSSTARVVNVVTPQKALQSDLTLPGSVQAIAEAAVNARTSGYIRKLYVDIGSRVRAGQLLAEIDSPEVDQQVAQAQADTAKSQAGTGQAEADVARLQAGVIQAQSEVLRSQAAIKQTQAEVARTAAHLAQSRAGAAQTRAKLAQSRQDLEGRRGSLERAKTDLDLADKTWQRWQELAKGGAVAKQEVDEKRAAYDSARHAVTVAQSAVASAQAEIDAAQEAVNASLADIQASEADLAASRQTVSAAQSALQSSKANVMAAQAGVRASQSNVTATQAVVRSSQADQQRYNVLRNYERIVAPFDGVITARNVDAGALVKADTGVANESGSSVTRSGLFGIARNDVLRIYVHVPQTFAETIRAGQTADILVHEFPGRVFKGIVYRTAGALDPSTRTLLTEVHIPNASHTLLPGIYADVRFVGAGSGAGLHVAANTVVTNAQGTQVVVVTKDNKVHYLPIVIGRDFGTEVEISTGLTGTERLITNPTDDLQEGMDVQIASASANTTHH
jgi:RND family efflux transporter MFP subunit